MVPSHYTTSEGGEWIEWTAGELFHMDLSLAQMYTTDKPGRRVAMINEIRLHALKFKSGRTWDCLNGWRRNHVPEQNKTEHEQS